jgi:hypothetical protein
MHNMDQFNFLDLDNDVLNIIGGYVKKDNLDRILKEKLKQDMLEYVDIKIKIDWMHECSLNRVSFGLNLAETAAGMGTHYLAKRRTKFDDYAFDSALRLRHRRPAASGQ